MENTLNKKVKLIDKKMSQFSNIIDKKLDFTKEEKSQIWNNEFKKTCETWGVTEEQYIEQSISY